ncbi:thermonuclease family protein [Terrabacter sp. MAHUQ-38]|uniref:thermonuclease family protein n=1 Tax=unclassified Terrabacter TaxID=2630222 RepID=UPI00165DCED0|nr:thermonuclease family protein [Terrabacter sp. MAHUQ-38]MBC9820414.1 thermonuclease family protein [Terrabacter sp. MAHUQ-38]
MRSRRTNGLITIGSLVVVAALAGNASRGYDEIALAGTGQQPAVTVTVTPTAAPWTSTSTDAASTDDAAAKAAAAKRAAEAKAAAAKKAADAKAAAAKAASDKAAKARAAAAAAAAKAAAATWAVTKVVDGDTIWVSRAGVSSKVRFIGIDTPESGQCGFTEARNALRSVIGGQRVTLTAGAQDDVDRYGRLLRYVDVNGVDAGLRLIKKGYAVARYDSRDGYGRHTRETAYVRADIASPKAACAEPDSGGSSGGTSGGAWPLSGDKYPCPEALPVKGNEDSWIAHEPGDRYYNVTKPEQCFATMSDAEAAGFRPAKV